MKTSTDRILTTHTGSLPRPKPLVDLILGREQGRSHRRRRVRGRDCQGGRGDRRAAGRGRYRHGQRRRDEQAVVHHLHPASRRRHRARPARRREGPRHHDRPRSPGASRLRRPPAEFQRRAVSGLRRPIALQGPQRARSRPRPPQDRGEQVEADRRVHDRAVAGHPHPLHHQPPLSRARMPTWRRSPR